MTFAPTVILITDPRHDLDRLVQTIDAVNRALPPGTLLVQLRDKSSAPEARDHAASRVRATGAPFVLNGTPEDAARVGAVGVHLPGEHPDVMGARSLLGDAAWVSTAAHDDVAVERALGSGASAVLVSPIFETPGKGPARGPVAIARARSLADAARPSSHRTRRRPFLVYALGGVDAQCAKACRDAGADGVAVIRAILDAPEPARAAVELASAFGSAVRLATPPRG